MRRLWLDMIFEARGVKMYYEVHGSFGRPLLLLHGWGGRCESFLPVTRDFETTRRVYAVDFPGHGRSDQPDCPWSVTEYMEYIRAFMEEIGIGGADIVAHSFGARVAILLAAEHPDAVGKLLLTGAAGVPSRKSGKTPFKTRVYKALRSLVGRPFMRRLFGEEKIDLWREALVQHFGSADYRALTPFMRQTFNRVIAQDLTPCLAKIKSPVLLVWGENDTATPLWMGQLMEKEIPDAGLVVLKGCGHFAYLDKYGEFRLIAESFLK